MDMQKMIVGARPDYETTNVPRVRWRRLFHKLVCSRHFELFILTCIIANMVSLSCFKDEASTHYLNILDDINMVFTGIFTVEAILKIIGFGLSYFRYHWNQFDILVVLLSLTDIVVTYGTAGNSTKLNFLKVIPQLARVLRVLRVLRFASKYEGLQALISTITFSIPSLANVSALLCLCYYMFAILGNSFFKHVVKG